MGGDAKNLSQSFLSLSISIHASVWEATKNKRHHDLPSPNFNPRLRMGGDLVDFHKASPSYQYFNPRLRMGGDARAWDENSALAEISIHASVWEATNRWLELWQLSKNFNPRLRMGGDTLDVYKT